MFSFLRGMQTFKRYLEAFIEPVFDSLTCGQQTTAAAAGEFIGQVRDLLGPNIWAGRLSQEQRQSQASSPHVPPPTGMARSLRLCHQACQLVGSVAEHDAALMWSILVYQSYLQLLWRLQM